MDPAYQLLLSDAELAVLGEVTVILGQIDEDMIRTVSGLIQADRATTEAVMGSTKTQNNSDIWSRLIGQRTKDLEILWLVDHAMKEFPDVQRGRNDFIHAEYVVQVPVTTSNGVRLTLTPGRSYMTTRGASGERIQMGMNGPVYAKRIRAGRTTPIAEIHTLRDKAARLSCLIAHIGWAVSPHGQGKLHNSPWHERLAPTLPPRPDGWEPGKAKAQQGQRKPSRQSRQSPQPRPAEE